MSENDVGHREPGRTRAMRFVTGAVMLGTVAPAAKHLLEFMVDAARFGASLETYATVAAVSLAMLAVAIAGASLVAHALRGTRPAHPFRLVALAIAVVVSVSVHRAGGLAPIIAGELGPATTQALSIAVLAAALVVHVVVHELGHVAAGRAMGSRLESLRLGPIAVRRVGERLRLEPNPIRVQGVLGSALSLPTRDEGFARTFAVTALGGPAATVALSLACWLGARAVSPPSSDDEAVASFVLWHAAAVGAFLVAVNLVPIRLRTGFRNDGSRILMALRARTAGAREALRFTLHVARGRRPREWGRTVDALVAAADSDPRYAPEVRLAALNVALDTGDVACADALLVRGCGMSRAGDAYHQEFLLQGALVAALVRGDAAGARSRLGEVGPMPLREYPLLAHAAAAVAEGDVDAARELLARWTAAVDRAGSPGLRVGNEWALEALRDRLA